MPQSASQRSRNRRLGVILGLLAAAMYAAIAVKMSHGL
jgi:hypothetical protein